MEDTIPRASPEKPNPAAPRSVLGLDPRRNGYELKERLEFAIQGPLTAARLEAIPGVGKALDEGEGAFTIHAPEAQPVLKSLIDLADAENLTLRGLTVEGATLEDVFIQLTGRRVRA